MTRTDLISTVQQQLSQGIAYARVSSDLILQEVSDNINVILHHKENTSYEGKHLTDVFWEYVGLEEQLRLVGQGQFHQSEYELQRINRPTTNQGQVAYLDLKISPLNNGDLLLIIEDATEFGRLEQAIIQERNELRLAQQRLAEANARLRQLDHLKSLFFSLAAHDLRAPLMVIHGYADLLHSLLDESENNLSDQVATNANEFIDTIRVQSNWLDNIIHNLIDLNRIDNDQLNLDLIACDLNAFVQETVAIMSPMARLNQQTLNMNVPVRPSRVLVDTQRIEQILQNLIGNAIKYTPPNGQITVEVRPCTHSGQDGVEVVVTDTGRGMTDEQLANVFQLYYRTADAARSDVRGSGLGLYIVRTLVEAHRGTISVTSEHGKGSTFIFWLPSAPTAA